MERVDQFELHIDLGLKKGDIIISTNEVYLLVVDPAVPVTWWRRFLTWTTRGLYAPKTTTTVKILKNSSHGQR